ncbi:galactosyldiacylglycerol synthase [Pseudolysobacter antarcticus]|uniref:Galactosyldiacylglycerol synthase n=1 Tax=Pseudolysobacter antarcticus TaxID=2511995 RepID=A0A411HHX3_9GAMM|nr:glycosyltransferase [Pseudolysobacter antarcticus]QBB70118.1 galactosyldiacylglycerol synthase [Pseudolysobacter antarcticus]
MHKKKILVLSVSAGAGHMRAAEALRSHAEVAHGDVHALHLDVMNFVSSAFRKLYTNAYIKLVEKHPALWGMLYRMTSEAEPDATLQKMRRGIERLNTKALLRAIDAFAPDAIICTHFLPAEILQHEIKQARLHAPVWVQVTDFDLHKMWVMPHMAGYFAANDEVAFRMRAAAIAPATIHVTGIPIMPAFAQPLSREECAREFGIDPARPTFLLMGGGAGVGQLDQVAERLMTAAKDFQLVVLAGKNVAVLGKLQKLAAQHPGRLFAQGFTHHVERLMACADLVITKPGGLTSSECLAMGVPMIVHSPIPGQEERNADYLLEQGAAMKAVDTLGLEFRIQMLLAEPRRLQLMRDKAAALGRPDAAANVLRIVLSALAARDSK